MENVKSEGAEIDLKKIETLENYKNELENEVSRLEKEVEKMCVI